MCSSHVPNMCWEPHVPPYINPHSSVLRSVPVRKLKLSQVKWTAGWQVAELRFQASPPVPPLGPHAAGACRASLPPRPLQRLTREVSSLADLQVFSAEGRAPQPLAFVPQMASPELPCPPVVLRLWDSRSASLGNKSGRVTPRGRLIAQLPRDCG